MTAARTLLTAGAVLVAATAAALAPVWTYALTLMLCGLPHVVSELRYLDQRFGARIDAPLWQALATALLGIALLRIAGVAGFGSAAVRASCELGLGAVLALAVLPRLRARGPAAAALGLGLLGLALWGALAAPLTAIVVFALLHNVTPVGLLAERLRGRTRRVALAWCAAVFVVVPLAFATGGVGVLLQSLGAAATAAGPWRVGGFDLHAGAFVPAPWQDTPFAWDLFGAAAFLQCAHFAVVLVVLPRLGPGAEPQRVRLPWPRRPAFAIVAATALLLLGFAAAFGDARAVYGVFASVHAWVEVPVLLLACSALPAVRARVAAVSS